MEKIYLQSQVNKNHYLPGKYAFSGRFVSYYHQIESVLEFSPSSILEIGAGDNVFGSYVKRNLNIDYKSLDIASDLSPDILGSVEEIPLNNKSYDIVCAFQVLEHLPFNKFEVSLKEMARVAKKSVVISLPHYGPQIKINLKLPLIPEIKFLYKIPHHPKHEFNGQHYWEIGKRGYKISLIKKSLLKYFEIKKDFIPFENPYHHFFLLAIKN